MSFSLPPFANFISRHRIVAAPSYKRIGCDAKATIRVMFQHRNKGKKIGGSTLDAIMRKIERYVGAYFVPVKWELCYQKRRLHPPRILYVKPTCCEDTVECVQCFAGTFLSCFKPIEPREFDLYSPRCCCCLHVPVIAVLVIGCILA